MVNAEERKNEKRFEASGERLRFATEEFQRIGYNSRRRWTTTAPALLVMKVGYSANDMAIWLAMCSYALTEDEPTSQVHYGPV